MRRRAVRRLHRSCRRSAGAVLHHARAQHRRQSHHDHRGGWQDTPRERRCRRPGSTSRWCNAAIANPARSCRPRRCSQVRRSRPMPTSTRQCPAMSADAEPISASVPPSIAPPTEKGSTMLDHSMIPRLDRRAFLKAGVAVGGGLVVNLVLPLAPRPAMAAAECRPRSRRTHSSASTARAP